MRRRLSFFYVLNRVMLFDDIPFLFGGMTALRKLFMLMVSSKLGIPYHQRRRDGSEELRFLVKVLARSNFIDLAIVFCVFSSKLAKNKAFQCLQ